MRAWWNDVYLKFHKACEDCNTFIACSYHRARISKFSEAVILLFPHLQVAFSSAYSTDNGGGGLAANYAKQISMCAGTAGAVCAG